MSLGNKLAINSILSWKKGKGITSLELSIVSLFFFVVIFLLIEVGRMMMTVSLLNNVSRTTARLAAVCPSTEHATIKQAARQVSSVSNIANSEIVIEYLDENMNSMNPAIDTQFINIAFVRSRIVGYNHNFLVPLLDRTFTFTGFDVLISSESLGFLPVDPTGAGFSCS